MSSTAAVVQTVNSIWWIITCLLRTNCQQLLTAHSSEQIWNVTTSVHRMIDMDWEFLVMYAIKQSKCTPNVITSVKFLNSNIVSCSRSLNIAKHVSLQPPPIKIDFYFYFLIFFFLLNIILISFDFRLWDILIFLPTL